MSPENLDRIPPIMLRNLKDQMLITLMKKLMDANGILKIPVDDVDDTEQDYLIMECDTEKRVFILTIGKKN